MKKFLRNIFVFLTNHVRVDETAVVCLLRLFGTMETEQRIAFDYDGILQGSVHFLQLSRRQGYLYNFEQLVCSSTEFGISQ